MTFRVITDETDTEARKTGQEPAAPESMEVGPLLDRLDALSAALDSLSTGDRTNSAEAVLETLSRMERRDLHAISAIDTFAIALRSVSQHLAHVRQAVHVGNTQNSTKLDGLVARLSGIEARLEAGLTGGLNLDFAPMAAVLDSISQRLAGLESKLDSAAQQQSNWPFDADVFASALAAIADRLVRVEAKVDRAAQQPVLEPEATNDMLKTIARRVSRVEHKVDSGADGSSIAACLLAVDHRLSRIEGGLGMDRPLPAAEEIPDLVDVMDVEAGLALEHGEAEAGQPEADPDETMQPAPDGRERVDVLLEQVFRVLAR